MKKDSTTISLALLLLNDLLRTEAIDEIIYNLASKKIIASEEDNRASDVPVIITTV